MLFIHHPIRSGPVHFGTRHMDESLDLASCLDDCIRNCLGSDDVGLKEKGTVENRSRHVSFCRKVNDDIGFIDERSDEGGIAHIAMPELQAWMAALPHSF